MQGIFFCNSLSYFIKNITLQITYLICSYQVFIVFQILLQIFSHYHDSVSKIFIVFEKL